MPQGDAAEVKQHDHCRELVFRCDRGPCSRWLDSGATWPGEEESRPLPTFVRHFPRTRAPPDPRDVHRCSAEAKARWAAAGWPEVCSHFETRNMVIDASGSPRLPNIAERERLHMLRRHHTLGAVRSSAAKASPGLDFAVRASMIGDGYHHGAVSWLMGALCFELGYLSAQPSMEQIVRREVCQLHVVRRNSCEAPRPRSSTVPLSESLTRWFLARTDARGSDVRLCTGELLQPRRISRQSVDAGL